MTDIAEFRRGLAATRGYLLSHHLPSERHRCYAPTILGSQIHLCARCSGVYPGIAIGLITYAFGPSTFTSLLFVTLLPLPALVDWTATTFTDRRGHNVLRTATGLLLGYGYGIGLSKLFFEWEVIVFGIGLAYALLTVVLLYLNGDL